MFLESTKSTGKIISKMARHCIWEEQWCFFFIQDNNNGKGDRLGIWSGSCLSETPDRRMLRPCACVQAMHRHWRNSCTRQQQRRLHFERSIMVPLFKKNYYGATTIKTLSKPQHARMLLHWPLVLIDPNLSACLQTPCVFVWIQMIRRLNGTMRLLELTIVVFRWTGHNFCSHKLLMDDH